MAKPMNEAKWLAAAHPQPMLKFLHHRGKASDRQLMLFACACCRAVWDLIPYDWGRQAAEAVERFLEGEISPAAAAEVHGRLQQGFGRLNQMMMESNDPHFLNPAIFAVTWACLPLNPEEPEAERIDPRRRPLTAAEEAANAAAQAAGWPDPQRERDWSPEVAAGMERQLCLVLRDIFGNPFHPRPVVEPSVLLWQGGTVPLLAAAAYQERDLPGGTLDAARLAVLADALEDAGSADAHFLEHLRGPGPHVRGCHVVDAIIAKE
jgi:hypothetical protein